MLNEGLSPAWRRPVRSSWIHFYQVCSVFPYSLLVALSFYEEGWGVNQRIINNGDDNYLFSKALILIADFIISCNNGASEDSHCEWVFTHLWSAAAKFNFCNIEAVFHNNAECYQVVYCNSLMLDQFYDFWKVGFDAIMLYSSYNL